MFHWLHGFCISKHSYEPPFYALLCSSMPAHNPFNSTSIYSIICNNCYVWLFNPTNLSAPLYTVKPYINGTFLVKRSVIVHDRNYIEKNKKTIGDIYGNSVIKWLIEQKKQLTDSAHMYLWWFSLKMFQSSTFISFLSSSETSQVIEVWPVHWILANYTEKYFSEISVYSCNFTLIVSYSQRLNINIAVIYKYK